MLLSLAKEDFIFLPQSDRICMLNVDPAMVNGRLLLCARNSALCNGKLPVLQVQSTFDDLGLGCLGCGSPRCPSDSLSFTVRWERGRWTLVLCLLVPYFQVWWWRRLDYLPKKLAVCKNYELQSPHFNPELIEFCPLLEGWPSDRAPAITFPIT